MATTNPFWIDFDRTKAGHQTPQQWRRGCATLPWRATARAYARAHGESRTMLHDGRVLRYLWDGTTMRQRTYTKVAMAS
jgi:hypothetical protein